MTNKNKLRLCAAQPSVCKTRQVICIQQQTPVKLVIVLNVLEMDFPLFNN